jgi:Helix-turn-helix domain
MTITDHSKGPAIKLALTRKEAAAALGVSPITIDRLTKRKLLNPSRATRRPLYSVAEIERFLRETTAEIPNAKAKAA